MVGWLALVVGIVGSDGWVVGSSDLVVGSNSWVVGCDGWLVGLPDVDGGAWTQISNPEAGHLPRLVRERLVVQHPTKTKMLH